MLGDIHAKANRNMPDSSIASKNPSRQKNTDALFLKILLLEAILLTGAIAALVVFWDKAQLSIGQAIGTIFAGCAAIGAAYLAYRGAMAKVEFDNRQIEHAREQAQFNAHLLAARVGRAANTQTYRLLHNFCADPTLTARRIHHLFSIIPYSRPEGLDECLRNGARLDPRIFVQLHRLANAIDISVTAINGYRSTPLTEQSKLRKVRSDNQWTSRIFKNIEDHLRNVDRISRVLTAMAVEKTGAEHRLSKPEEDAYYETAIDFRALPPKTAYVLPKTQANGQLPADSMAVPDAVAATDAPAEEQIISPDAEMPPVPEDSVPKNSMPGDPGPAPANRPPDD